MKESTKKHWEAPEIIDLDVDETRTGGAFGDEGNGRGTTNVAPS